MLWLYKPGGMTDGRHWALTELSGTVEDRLFYEAKAMDKWEELYERAKEQYHPEEVSPFVYAHHVVCALEAENGEIFTGFCIESCSGVLDLCAERVAALNMYMSSGQTVIKKLIAFRDKAPFGEGSGMPCGACREFLMQLNIKNREAEIMVDYAARETVTLGELLPDWGGMYRCKNAADEDTADSAKATNR